MRFLIIDDDIDFRNLTKLHLQNAFPENTIRELATRREFDEALADWDFDVVITDLENAEIDGLTVCREIRERDPYLPVIMLTGSGNEELTVEGMKSGLSDYVTKSHLIRLPVAVNESIGKATMQRELDRAARLLKNSEERFRAFMDNSPVLHFIEDENGRLVFANKAFERIFEKQLDGVCGTSIHDFVSAEIANTLRGRNSAVLAEDKVVELCAAVPNPEGISHHWLFIRFPIKDDTGRRYIGTVALDINERKLNEERQAAQFKLTEIFIESDTLNEAAPKLLQAICEGFGWELGELWRADPGATRLRLKDMWHTPSLGTSEFEKISRTLDFMKGIGLPGRVWASNKPVWITDVVTDSNFPRAAIAGKIGLHSAIAFPITQGNEIIGVMDFFTRKCSPPDENLFKIMHDIGIRIGAFINRKQAEQSLRKSEHKYRVLLENLPQKIFHKDRHSVYVSCNKNYARDLGIQSHEITGKTDYDFFPEELADKYRADDKRLMESGKTEEIEEKYIRDGQEFTIHTVKTPIKDERGEIVGILGIFRDITERKRAEQEREKLREQLYHAQKIDSIGTLAGGVAHDFNNILTAIIGYGNLLLWEIKEDSKTRDFTQKIIKSAERAAQLTKGLLVFSRKQPNNPKPVNINDIVKGVNDLLTRLVREDIKLRAVLTDKDCIVMADSSQIEQVLMNLATNARDAMPKGGCLTISTDIIFMDDSFIKAHGYGAKGFYALISVSDTGTGMDEKTKEKIFEPFFTTKEVGKGTGLGLAIVYGIVKQHNGYTNVYSEPGRGTTFRVYLPLINIVHEKKKADIHNIPKGGTETILLAEDDADVRNITKITLEGRGYTVIEAVDGIDAIKKFNENKDRIQLLLLDVIMPVKNGKEAYKAIQATTPDIKTIFMSGYSKDIIQDEDIIKEELTFITKPVLPMELLRKIREVLDK